MTNPNYTALALVSDRSGSMGRIQADAEGGINAFVKQQAEEPGEATIFFVQFDDGYEVVHDNVPITAAAATPYVLHPRGATALNDAIGRTIQTLGSRLDKMSEDERPGKVIVAIVTDGQENTSREFSTSQVREMINHQTDVYGWEFVYLASNQDAIVTGAQYGFSAGNSLTFASTSTGTAAAFTSLGNYATRSRSNAGSVNIFTEAERNASSS